MPDNACGLDWVTIVLGSRRLAESPSLASDAEVIGYIYQPGGNLHRYDPITFLPEQVCHFAPIPDPLAHFHGMSWLTPIVREVMGDNAATNHKLTFFEKGATPNMVVTLDPQFTPEQVSTFADRFRQQHREVAEPPTGRSSSAAVPRRTLSGRICRRSTSG